MSKRIEHFGTAADLHSVEYLPSVKDIICYGKLLHQNYSYPLSSFELAKLVASPVLSIWRKASDAFSPPITITEDTLYHNIQKILIKAYKSERLELKTHVRDKFIRESVEMMEFTKCQCPIKYCQESGCDGCPKKVHINCTHPLNERLPEALLLFLRY